MKKETKRNLINAWIWCDIEDKSTEFMLQYMADSAKVTFDRAVDFVQEYTRTPEDYRLYHRKDIYTRQEVFMMLAQVAETLTYSKDPVELIEDGLNKIKFLAKTLE